MLLALLRFLFVLLLFIRTGIVCAQWQSVNSNVLDNLVDGCFVNTTVGYVLSSNGKVLKTNDGGTTWLSNANLTGVFTSICHVGTNTLYAGGNCIYKSTNGGGSWQLISNLSYTITDLVFFDNQKGYAIVPNYYNCTYSGGGTTFDYFKVYKSMDDGTSWSWQYEFNYAENTSRFQLLNDSSVYLTSGHVSIDFHCGGSWHNDSKRSNNKGTSWFSFLQPYYGHAYYSFINDSLGYFVQNNNSFSIYKTTDGGMSINQSYTEIEDVSIKQCKFLNVIDGYLLGRTKIYGSRSNGFCWKEEFSASDSLNFLFHNPNGNLFCIGAKGLILKKTHVPSAFADTIYRIKLDQKSLPFGYVKSGDNSIKTLSISNTGHEPLNLSLTTTSNFYQISLTNISFVSALSVSLNPFQDTVLYINFSPLQDQHYKDTLQITAIHLNTVKVPLDGTGFYGLTGSISHDTLICVDTLRIGSNISINSGAKLSICPGTYVQSMGDFMITVNGELEALGDSMNRIRFAVHGATTLLNGIYLSNPNPGDTSVFSYCDFIFDCKNPLLIVGSGIGKVDHCSFSNQMPGGGGIAVNKGLDVCKLFISNSSIFNNKGVGIVCGFCDSSSILNNLIFGNTKGIQFSTGYCLLISGNSIYNNTQDGIYGFGRFSVFKNKIYNNGNGIYCSGNGIKIENNVIYNNLGGGINCGAGAEPAIIHQNLIFNNSATFGYGGGLRLAPESNSALHAYVTNNTICNNRAWPTGTGHNFHATGNSSYGLKIKLFNNIFYDASYSNNSIAWFSGVDIELKYNCINQSDINSWGQNNIATNPNFLDPTESIGLIANPGNFNWALRASSYCINAGDSALVPNLSPFDFSGNKRIYNNRIDIGAYEFQGDFVDAFNPFANGNALVFPNPASDLFTVYVNSAGSSTFELYDITSRYILGKEFVESSTINVSVLSDGIYLYKIKNETGTISSGKLVKHKL